MIIFKNLRNFEIFEKLSFIFIDNLFIHQNKFVEKFLNIFIDQNEYNHLVEHIVNKIFSMNDFISIILINDSRLYILYGEKFNILKDFLKQSQIIFSYHMCNDVLNCNRVNIFYDIDKNMHGYK